MKQLAIPYLHNRPAIFDWMVFMLSFALGFIYPEPAGFVKSPAFSGWMLFVLLLYILGSWLKHVPLSSRVQQKTKKREIPYVIFLLAGHVCIIMVVMIFAGGALFRMIGLQTVYEKDPSNMVFVFTTMALALVVTWMVYRAKKLSRTYPVKSPVYLFRRELIADIFLVISVSVMSFVFWEKGVIEMLSRKTVTSFSEVWFLFLMLSFLYVLLYLPLRYLYLVEDHSSRQTWRRMLLIFAFLLLRSFFEIMRIG